MISRIPALEFLQSLAGSYTETLRNARLRVWHCGHGVAIDLILGEKTVLCGVAGAFNQAVECFVLTGLPNVSRALGRMASESALHLTVEDLPIEIRFAGAKEHLLVSVSLQGQEKASYEFSAV